MKTTFLDLSNGISLFELSVGIASFRKAMENNKGVLCVCVCVCVNLKHWRVRYSNSLVRHEFLKLGYTIIIALL